jgi:fumarylacetoacetate (FAA) hydrolase
MKLLSYETGMTPRCGVLVEDDVVDVTDALRSETELRDVHDLLRLANRPLDRLRDALDAGRGTIRTPLAGLRLRAPVIQPPTVRDFAAFEEHITQQYIRADDGTIDGFGYLNMEVWRRMPVFYFSSPLKMLGPDEDLVYPAATKNLDYECEIGMVILREGRDILEADAADYIAGFTVLNDWSPRDIQADEMGGTLGPVKGKDCGTSIGPWVVTPDEFGDQYRDGVLSLRAQVRVNGETWTDRSTWNMVHSFGAMIERASQDSRIVPGDVIGSGTIGMGTTMEAARLGRPARWLRPGDVVEMEIEGIGVLRNRIVEPSRDPSSIRWPAPFSIPMPEPLAFEQIAAVEQRVAQTAL